MSLAARIFTYLHTSQRPPGVGTVLQPNHDPSWRILLSSAVPSRAAPAIKYCVSRSTKLSKVKDPSRLLQTDSGLRDHGSYSTKPPDDRLCIGRESSIAVHGSIDPFTVCLRQDRIK